MTRLQQIVAKHGVFGKSAIDRPLESIHIIDSFADKRAFLKNILIYVGNCPRVRINARIARKKPDKPRPPGTWQTHANAWLQDAIAFGDDTAHGIEHRPVQRMRHRADKLSGGIAWQLGVGVERDDILDGG